MGRYYFLVSSLPAVPPSLGEKFPLSFSEISQSILRNIEPGDEPLVRCCLQKIDTANVEYALQGQDVFLPGGTLTRDDIENRRSLPHFLRTILDDKDKAVHRGYEHDNLWEGYYAFAYSVAEELNCRFLIDYLSWEIGLRNSLVIVRSRAIGEEAEDYQIMKRAAVHDFTSLISQLKMQQNPLRAEQLLDEERLKRIFHCEGADPFSRDAVLAFLERARIYDRWEKLSVAYHIPDTIGDGGSDWNTQ